VRTQRQDLLIYAEDHAIDIKLLHLDMNSMPASENSHSTSSDGPNVIDDKVFIDGPATTYVKLNVGGSLYQVS